MQKISYVGDGIAYEFAFKFPFFQEADVRVAVNNAVLDGAYYDINPDEDMKGGTVIFAAPPTDGAFIDIFRKIHLERFIDYQPTAKLDVESLNSDFNFIIEAFRDLNSIDQDMAEWKNIHDNVLNQIEYTKQIIEDKLSGGGVLGLYNNLLSVLVSALPRLINDYGTISGTTSINPDDYGNLYIDEKRE